MATRGPWSVKGIDSKAREAALQAARSEGITLGDYLNRLLLEGEVEENDMSGLPKKSASNDASPPFSLEALEKLTRRVEAVEAKSTLAITGIDQSVVGLLSRLEHNENARSAIEGRLDLAADEIRQAQQVLEKRIDRMESDDTGLQNLRALKSLETALGRLASRVEDETEARERALQEVDSVSQRMNTLSEGVDEKIGKLTNKVESTLDSAAGSIAKAVEQAELRTEGTSRHLSERMSKLENDLFEDRRNQDDRFKSIETSVQSTLNNVSVNIDRLGERMSKTEDHAIQALTHVDDQRASLSQFAERLNRAETTTDAALKELEHHFTRLDNKLGEMDADVDGGLAGLKKHFEDRIKLVATELAQTIASIRDDMATQIDAATHSPNAAFAEINTAVSEMHKRMKKAEKRQNDAIEAIGEEFARLTQSLDRRVSQIEGRNDTDLTSTVRDQIDNLSNSLDKRISELESRDGGESLNAVSQQMNELADVLDKRVNASEERSAAAIRDFTEHVATLTRNLSAKQDQGLKQIASEIKDSEKRQSDRMEKALSGVKERIAQVEEATASSVSPIQKAMASLAERLQAVEDFATPPGAPRPSSDPVNLVSFEDRLSKVNASHDKKSAPDDLLDDSWDEPVQKKTARNDFPDIPDISDFDSKTDKSRSAPTEDLDELHDPWADDEDVFSDTPSPVTDDSYDLDDDFAADLPAKPDESFDLDAANSDPDDFERAFDEPEEPMDYISRARAAANASQDNNRSRKHSPKRAKKSSSGSSKIPLVAAASVLAITAAGTAGYMMMRGKQDPGNEPMLALPSNAEPTVADVAEGGETPDISKSSLPAPIEANNTGKAEAAETAEEPEQKSAQANSASGSNRTEEARTETVEPRKAAEPVKQPPSAPRESAPTRQTAAEPRSVPTQPPPAPVRAEPEIPLNIQQYQAGMEAINSGRITEGAELLRQSAESGQASAQYRMAKLYERGQGVPRDLEQSRYWTEKAANGGNVKAMHDLAVFYAEGEGGPQSYQGAVQWFRMAADYGLVDSQYNLGILYEQGLGVTENKAEALYWFRVAQKLGDSAAASKVRELVSLVPAEDAEKTARLAGQYRAKTSDPLANGRFPSATSNSADSTPADNGRYDPALVMEAQSLLNSMGYNAGAPDGDLGPTTQQALLNFQAANNLPQSTQVTPTLIRQLRAAAGQ